MYQHMDKQRLCLKKISKITKSKYVVALNSGTSALHLSIVASGIKRNEEVLIPALNL